MPTGSDTQSRHLGTSLLLQLLNPETPFAGIEINRDQVVELWPLALKHNVAMLIDSRLRRHEADLTTDAKLFLDGQKPYLLASIAQSARQESEGNRLQTLFELQVIDACIIKGNAIARRIYGDPNSRSSSDIDILVRVRDIDEVDRLLVGAGYERLDQFPLRFWLERIHHAVYSIKEKGHTVEVHWSFGIPSFFYLTSDDIWAKTERNRAGQIVLLPEMQVVQTLMHHHMHAFREMRSLVDLLWTFHTYADVIDWQQFASRLKDIGLVKSAQITLLQLTELWGETCKQMRSVQGLSDAFTRMGFSAPKILSEYFRIEPLGNDRQHPVLDKLMMRFVLDRMSTIWRSFQKSIIPSSKTIMTFYADRRAWMLPAYYLRFLGWRLKEWLS